MWVLMSIIALLATFFYFNFVKVFKHWERKGVPHKKPVYILGNFAPVIFQKKSMQEIMEDIYKKFSNHRYVGIYLFNERALMIRDLELIKQIMIKDFDSFTDHKPFVPAEIDPLWGKNLFQMTARDGWHSMRATLSPSFTSSKLKSLFLLMQECSKQFIDYFKTENNGVSFEAKDAFTRFANDIIGTSAFGINCDSLKNPNNEFYQMGKEATDFSGLKLFKFFGYGFSPSLMKLFGVKIFNEKMSTFFRRLIQETLDYRKEKNIVRPDMIHLMLEAQKAQEKHENTKPITEFTNESMTAQALIFFTAGFETVSSALTYTAYELAVNSDVQQKLFEEITEAAASNNNKVTYEALFAMEYLDCVVSESMRLHTPVPNLDRVCTKSYTIDPVLPEEKPITLEKGIVVAIPASAIHNDEQYFPNPNKFDPERFNSKNNSNFTPFTNLTFGSGPRNCIGSRFALLEIKLLLVELLQHFEIVPNEKTQIPLVRCKTNFNGIPKEGIWLSFKPRVLN